MSQEQIYVALDVPTLERARELAEELSPYVGGFKVGLELLNAAGAPQVVSALNDLGRPIFFDAKFYDIPNTVAGAVRATASLGVYMLNVHALGGIPMMQAAVQAASEGAAAAGVTRSRVLAVTLLTSFSPEHLQSIGLQHVDSPEALQQQVVHLAQCAQEAGCDGVVASPWESDVIRAACGDDFLIVTPGVRPSWAASGDQKRIKTPRDAIAAGASHIVIGRPITQPPAEVGSPAAAAQKILEELS